MPDAPATPLEPNSPIISVCVCSFRRPALLAELLEALSRQCLTPTFEVVVVDNDAGSSAGSVLAAAQERYPSLSLRNSLVPEQNIARSRNRAVSLARGRFVAFLDDDERPIPRWLGAMHRALLRFGADGVFGPVVPELPSGVPAWIRQGGFFDRRRHASGALVPADELRTGNALLRRELLSPRAGSDEEGPFDPRYGLSGGEDSALFAELLGRGARFAWCDDAVVHERVPPERATLRYLVARSFGGGCGHARFRLEREGLRAVPTLLLRAAGAITLSSALLPATLPLGRHHVARTLRIAAGGAGKLAGALGYDYQPYRARTG